VVVVCEIRAEQRRGKVVVLRTEKKVERWNDGGCWWQEATMVLTEKKEIVGEGEKREKEIKNKRKK